MRILFDNVSFSSNSGPNQFGTKLAKELSFRGHVLADHHENPDVQLSFIQATTYTKVPIVQRLDGIWFNSAQDWQAQNKPIKQTFDHAKEVIIQSAFDQKLVEKFFGSRPGLNVIHNGTDINFVQSVDPLSIPTVQNVNKVWACASSWRPHKRLSENIRYFREHRSSNDILVIAGENPDSMMSDPHIFYAGSLDYQTLISLYRTSDYFLHLALCDHCPNVVVDARAAGCHIICSSTGGTEEIAGLDSTVIEEDEWNFEPFKLYEPKKLDFSRKREGKFDVSIDIVEVAAKYESILDRVR